MNPYFNLTHPDSEHLMAERKQSWVNKRIPCPMTTEHAAGFERIGPLDIDEFVVRHNRREEQIIWAWSSSGFAIHERLLEEFDKEAFTGYQVKPATVRFRDGSSSAEYREFIVTGWGGMASPESGVHLLKSCPGCDRKEYSAITNYEKVVDWSQWAGEDFFIVYPMVTYKLVTARVAQWLLTRKVKSFRVEEGFALRERDSILSRYGFSAGRLSNYVSEDIAMKYGSPLGLE